MRCMRGALPHALPENGGFLRVRFGEEMGTNDRKKIRNDVILAVVLLLLAAAALIALVPILGLVLPGLTVTAQCFFIEKILKQYMDDEEAQTDD